MLLLRPPGVYRPQQDTWLLAGALADAPLPAEASVLDLCTGTGALAVMSGLLGAREVTAIDVSRRAVLAARLNGFAHGIPVKAMRTDVSVLVGRRRFDVVLANPPYVPCAPVPSRGKERAWDAGPRGRAVLDRLCAVMPLLLTAQGMALIVHFGMCGTDVTLNQLRGAGLKASVVARKVIPFGPVLLGRAELLESEGLIEPGQREEELVVIRADVTTR
jgi:release factor glutamine methyltransferase